MPSLYSNATATWVGFVTTTSALGIESNILLRAISLWIWRIRALIIGSPSACLNSSAQVPETLRAELDQAAAAAIASVGELRRWMLDDYAPRTEGVPDGVGAGRYPVLARAWLGTELDLADTYMWGWSEYRRIMAEMAEQAERVLPGATSPKR